MSETLSNAMVHRTTPEKRPLWQEVLPAEIRLKIYEHYFSDRHVFLIGCHSLPRDRVYRSRMEPLLSVCHETRQKALQEGFFLRNSPWYPSLYVQKNDIVLLTYDGCLDVSLSELKYISSYAEPPHSAFSATDSIKSIQNLAILWRTFVMGHMYPCPSHWIDSDLSGLRRVQVLIIGDGPYGGDDVEPADIKPVPRDFILPTFYKKEENRLIENGTLETCEADIIGMVRAIFEPFQARNIDVEVCLLHGTRNFWRRQNLINLIDSMLHEGRSRPGLASRLLE